MKDGIPHPISARFSDEIFASISGILAIRIDL